MGVSLSGEKAYTKELSNQSMTARRRKDRYARETDEIKLASSPYIQGWCLAPLSLFLVLGFLLAFFLSFA